MHERLVVELSKHQVAGEGAGEGEERAAKSYKSAGQQARASTDFQTVRLENCTIWHAFLTDGSSPFGSRTVSVVVMSLFFVGHIDPNLAPTCGATQPDQAAGHNAGAAPHVP